MGLQETLHMYTEVEHYETLAVFGISAAAPTLAVNKALFTTACKAASGNSCPLEWEMDSVWIFFCRMGSHQTIFITALVVGK